MILTGVALADPESAPKHELLGKSYPSPENGPRDRFPRQKYFSNTSDAGLPCRCRNVIENGGENGPSVTTSHLFRPNQRRNGGLSLRFWLPNSNCLGTERNPGPDRLATRRRVRTGGRRWKRRRLPMLLMGKEAQKILAKRAPVARVRTGKKRLSSNFHSKWSPYPNPTFSKNLRDTNRAALRAFSYEFVAEPR